MRSGLLLILLSLLLIGGCSENSNLVSNVDIDNEAELVKLNGDFNGSQVESTITLYQNISGDDGGKLEFDERFPGFLGSVRVKGKLEVPKGAYSGNKKITLIIDDNYAYVDFGPSPQQFNLPLNFEIEYKGLNLTGLTNSVVDFSYIKGLDQFVSCSYSEISFNILKGELKVKGAKLNHFSRYGFTKRNLD